MDQAAAEASSSHEMLEIIKLAKLYKLDSLFKACESHFKELMVQNFDCTNLITLKTSGSSKKKREKTRYVWVRHQCLHLKGPQEGGHLSR